MVLRLQSLQISPAVKNVFICTIVIAAYLHRDSQILVRQPLETGRPPSEGGLERLVLGRVPDVLPRVIEEEDAEVVVEGVADQDAAEEDVRDLLLHSLEVLA